MATLGEKAVGDIVKLKVNGVATDFIVVHQGLPSSAYDSSCNGTWLLAKDIYENRALSEYTYNSEKAYKYGDAKIHSYLNGDFLSLFDSDIQSAIKQVEIPCKYMESEDSEVTVQLPTRIFLLSYEEVGLTISPGTHFHEGAKLDYFVSGTSGNSKRIAYYNGTAQYWWLRSIENTDYEQDRYCFVFTTGNLNSALQSNKYGVRPALILPSDFKLPSSFNGKTTIGGVQKELTGAHVNIGGAWKDVTGTYMNIGGTWKPMN